MKRWSGAGLALALAAWAPRTRADAPALPDPVDPAETNWVVPTLHGAGVMTGMRIGAAIIWPEPFADPDLGRIGRSYERAYTSAPRWDPDRDFFEWDGDPWPVNAVGHALFGSELYLRARSCHFRPLSALAFTAAGSVVWEYGFEASAVQPSALDLVYTPVAGIALGELRYLGWQLASRLDHRAWRGVLKAVLDPLGEFGRALGTVC